MILIGCSGWYYQHWQSSFYKNIAKKNWFEHYCRHFKTVELNNSFYRFPTEELAKKWYSKAPADFKYSIKANRIITHYKRFKNCKRLIKDFYQVCDTLEEKLACVLFQLPANFLFDQEKLNLIVHCLNPNYKNVVEFRHLSWWNDAVFKAFKTNKIIFCNVSAENFPVEIKKTSADIYLRFHGLPSHEGLYTNHQLKNFAKKINSLKSKNSWLYFNNDIHAYAIKNAKMLENML